jgi:hypothetical protein
MTLFASNLKGMFNKYKNSIKKSTLKQIMNKVLEYIANEISVKTYKSHRFCFDVEFNIPSLSYDDSQPFNIKNDRYGKNTLEKKTKSLTIMKICMEFELPFF